MKAPLPHPRAQPLALVFTEIGTVWTKAAVHAAFPAVLHGFTHIRAPTRVARQNGNADADRMRRPEQVQTRRIDEACMIRSSCKPSSFRGILVGPE